MEKDNYDPMRLVSKCHYGSSPSSPRPPDPGKVFSLVATCEDADIASLCREMMVESEWVLYIV